MRQSGRLRQVPWLCLRSGLAWHLFAVCPAVLHCHQRVAIYFRDSEFVGRPSKRDCVFTVRGHFGLRFGVEEDPWKGPAENWCRLANAATETVRMRLPTCRGRGRKLMLLLDLQRTASHRQRQREERSRGIAWKCRLEVSSMRALRGCAYRFIAPTRATQFRYCCIRRAQAL